MPEQNRPFGSGPQTVINYQEPAAKSAPVFEVGALAWIRKNLFSSPLDVILTVVSIVLILSVLVTFFAWSIESANWFAITYNMKRFMVGNLDFGQIWRVSMAVIFASLAVGITIAAYSRRLSLKLLLVAALVVLPVFIIPPVANALFPLPPVYLAAGTAPIVSGSSSEQPIERLAFIANAGEQIRFELASDAGQDTSLSGIASFMDRATNTLRNAAINRANGIVRLGQLDEILAQDEVVRQRGVSSGSLSAAQRQRIGQEYATLAYEPSIADADRIAEITASLRATDLDDAERAALEAERLALTQPPLISDVYNVNRVPASIIIRDRDLDILAEFVLEPEGSSLTFQVPAAGWYVLDKQTVGEGTAILAVTGIYPVYETERSGTREFIRVVDDFTITDTRPRVDDDDVRTISLLENVHRGVRSFGTWFRVYLATFLWRIGDGVAQIAVFVIIGYLLARLADRTFSNNPQKPRQTSRRMSTWFLIATPLVIFAYVNGLGPAPLDFTDSRRWGGLLLTMFITIFGILLAFPIGVGLALGRRSELPAIKYLCTFIIEIVRGTPFIVVLFAGQLFIPLININLGFTQINFGDLPNVYRALGATVIFIAAYLAENVRGGLQSVPPGQEEAARALGLSQFQIIAFITLPQALRAVIPALVGQFISLFKDTSLLVIVGLIDLTGVVNSMVAQPEFSDARREGLLFISIIYFVFSYVMSFVSRRLEESGSGSARRI